MATRGDPSHRMPEHSALVHPIYARLLRMLLQQAEVDGDRVLAAAGLDWGTLMTEDRRLGRETVMRLAQAAMAATRRPWLGLDLGDNAPVSAHGALGYAAVTAHRLREALETLARYAAIRNDALCWSYTPQAGGAVVRAVELADLGPGRGFVVDTVLAAVLRVVATAVGQWPASLRVDLPFAAPPWREQYQRFAPVEMRFGQPVLALHFDAAALALPCLGADAKAHAAACRDCEEALAEMAGASLAQRVASLLAGVQIGANIGANVGSPAGGYPQLADVAAQCGLSPRTLMRRLRADGTRYQHLLDAARKERALWFLQHTELPVEEIAGRLGYVDVSNFSRTVRRWFAATPGALRESARTRG